MKYVPNILTTLRLLMIPVFIYFFYRLPLVAAVVFTLACITDIVDGYLARRFNVVSKFGMLFDPLADKLLQISAFLCLCFTQVLPVWAVTIVVVKELLMIAGALFLLKKNQVIPANRLGKLGTVVSFIAVISLIAAGVSDPVAANIWSVVIVIAALTTLTGYVIIFVQKLKR